MRSIRYLLLVPALITIFSEVALGQGWRGIEPLHSTRTDVEKLLGPPPSGAGYTYDLENEKVHFQYRNPESECGKTWGYWNAPLNTVLFIIVVPKEKKPLAELGLDRTYVKSHTCMPGTFNYSNEDDGITYYQGCRHSNRLYASPERSTTFILPQGVAAAGRKTIRCTSNG